MFGGFTPEGSPFMPGAQDNGGFQTKTVQTQSNRGGFLDQFGKI